MAFITLAEAKRHIGGNANSTAKDELIQEIIDAACSAVEGYLQRKLDKAERTEYHDGTEGDFFYVDNPPIDPTQPVTVWIDSSREFPDHTKLKNEGRVDDEYVVGRDNDCIELLCGKLPRGKQIVKVTYTGGYGENLPQDIRLATLLTIQHWYGLDGGGQAQLGKGQSGVTGRGYVGNLQGVAVSAIPPQAKKLLEKYVADTGLGW